MTSESIRDWRFRFSVGHAMAFMGLLAVSLALIRVGVSLDDARSPFGFYWLMTGLHLIATTLGGTIARVIHGRQTTVLGATIALLLLWAIILILAMLQRQVTA